MAQWIKVIDSNQLNKAFGDHETFALDVLVGLSDTRKHLSSRYLYDDEGSRLFNKITQLEEYYPTNCEKETLRLNGDVIANYLKNDEFNLVELGPGDGSKAAILMEHFLEKKLKFHYIPIDISEEALNVMLEYLQPRFPELEINGLIAEYFTALKFLNSQYQRRNLVLFMGSNIGNFTHAQARYFLRHLWNCLNDGDLVLIGFDLKKDIEMFLSAYNDSQGVTSAFNLNLLKRINRELGGQFNAAKFRHFGTYDVFSGAMESYLVSLEKQEVFIKEIGRSFQFRSWEPIHVEYSYKYLESDITGLAQETGFVMREHIYDSKRYFVDSIWEVKKETSPVDDWVI